MKPIEWFYGIWAIFTFIVVIVCLAEYNQICEYKYICVEYGIAHYNSSGEWILNSKDKK